MSMDPRVGRVEAEGGAGMRMKGTREDQSSATSRDLLVIGPGVLGRLFASKWKEVSGQTEGWRRRRVFVWLQGLG